MPAADRLLTPELRSPTPPPYPAPWHTASLAGRSCSASPSAYTPRPALLPFPRSVPWLPDWQSTQPAHAAQRPLRRSLSLSTARASGPVSSVLSPTSSSRSPHTAWPPYPTPGPAKNTACSAQSRAPRNAHSSSRPTQYVRYPKRPPCPRPANRRANSPLPHTPSVSRLAPGP